MKAGTLEPQDCSSLSIRSVVVARFVIEGAMMAADMAPGILRDYWGFSGRRQFDPEVFARLLAEADARLEAGLARTASTSWEAISIRVLSRSLVLKQGG